ncbi:MAG TPA: CpsD/CapB family tyrosine-protein kinase [Terriglobales bacterium]|nr:CpsD/CapB family tyrosine-protein kinase [Terriglobales bacterium]
MSKNFELLQSVGKPHIFAAEETMVAPQAAAAEVAPPLLEMDEGQRDELNKLVQRLFLQPNQDCRSVVFSGTEAGNGCTWTCARAAEILLSQRAASVCLVDANLRSPGLHQQFGVENHHGLSNSLLVADPVTNFVCAAGRSNLWLLSCGADPASCQGLLGSDRMRARLAELRAQFDYVLVDAPSIGLGNESVLLGQASDGLVLVLKANASRKERVRRAIQELTNGNVRVLGAVLNQRTFPTPAPIYNRL